MAKLDYREFYRRNLPHFQPAGSTFFVTFRLAGSIPRAVLERWRVEQAASLRRAKSRETEEQKTQAGSVRYIQSRETEEQKTQAGSVRYIQSRETEEQDTHEQGGSKASQTQAGSVRHIEEQRRRFAQIERYLDKAGFLKLRRYLGH